MKNFLYSAMAILTLASCTSDEFMGDESIREANNNAPISFGFDVPAATRAAGADAATALGNQFIVYAEKNETSDGAEPATGNLVIQNYQVNYGTNTAYTTTSNTKDWEYVGYQHTSNYSSNITPSTIDVQTIKYWDYSANNYVFTAFSALEADLSNGYVKVTKTQSATDGNKVYDKGYTVDVTANADLSKLYFADRVQITQGTGKDRTATNQYGGNVTFTFRNAASQVRVGLYETVPGYEVKVTKFYYVNNENPTFTTMTMENTTAFCANVPNIPSGVAGNFTVKYYPKSTENDAANITNHPTVSFVPTASTDKKNYITLGTNIISATSLAVTSATPTYDKDGGGYTTVMPQEANDKNLKLKIDYQLKNSITGETINIEGKTAEVPAQYLQWKPNFRYTYLFKISDNDLYPITFDAVVIEAEDGQAEYITTVCEPSITTFGVKNGKYVAGKNEYETETDIYAVIMSGSTVVDPVFMGDVHLYKVSSSDETTFPVTEASVAEALAETSTGTKKITYEHVCGNYSPAKVTSVPAEDGTTISMNAIKFKPTETGYYAIQYRSGATYEEVTLNADTPLEGYYTKTGENYVECSSSGTADGSTTYYKLTSLGTPVYKVIKVQ